MKRQAIAAPSTGQVEGESSVSVHVGGFKVEPIACHIRRRESISVLSKFTVAIVDVDAIARIGWQPRDAIEIGCDILET